MLDDRVLAAASAVRIGDELILSLVDDAGHVGQAVVAETVGLVDRLVGRLTAQCGRPITAAEARWLDRPREAGADWLAFAAVENGLAALLAAAAGVPLREWLGGTLRDPATAVNPAMLELERLDVSNSSFDHAVNALRGTGVGIVAVDVRRWPLPAIQRLDGVCRVLQLGLSLECPPDSLAGSAVDELLAALPMATLGCGSSARLPVTNGQSTALTVGVWPT